MYNGTMNELEYVNTDTDAGKTAKARKAAPKPESTKHLRTLANGAIYDMRLKRIVAIKPELAVKNTQITSANASAMQARGVELKREAMKRAANRVAEQGGSVNGSELVGDLAFVEAIGEAMTMKALSVNDAKAVEAAKFIFAETGYGERQQTSTDSPVNDDLAAALRGIVDFMRARTIEGEVLDG